MTVRKSISFTDQHDEWIKGQLGSGQYSSESEVIRDLIRQAQKRDDSRAREHARIRAALIEAESRAASELTAEDVRRAVQDRLRKNGQL